MTSSSTGSDSSAVSLSDRAPGAGRLSVKAVIGFIGQEWHWLVLAAIYFFGWYSPFTDHGVSGDGPLRWCWEDWRSITHTLGWQPFVPIAAGVYLWSIRKSLSVTWQNRVVSRYPIGHPRRQGSLVPLGIACFVLFVSHLVEVKGVGIFALIAVVWGVVFRVYGPIMLRAMVAPLVMLFLMMPPPDHVTLLATNNVTAVFVKMAAGLLSLAGLHGGASGTLLLLRGYGVTIDPATCSGTNVILAVMLILFTYQLCRKIEITVVVLTCIIGGVVSTVLQAARVVSIGILYGPAPETSVWLTASALVAWVEIGLAVFLTLQLMRISFLERARTPLPVLRSLEMMGKGFEVLTIPLVRSLAVFSLLASAWNRSERTLEKWIKAVLPKRKKNRGRW